MDTLAEEVLDVVEDDGRVIDGIDLDAGQASRELSGKALRR